MFKALVTSITGKVIDVSGKKPCFEIIKSGEIKDTSVTIVVDMHGRRNSLRSAQVRHISEKKQVW